MKKRIYKILSFILAIVMVIGLMPTFALAANPITITVVDEQGNPVQGATVSFERRRSNYSNWDDNYSETTGRNGQVSKSMSNNYTYRAIITADGYESVTTNTFNRNSNHFTVTLKTTGSSGGSGGGNTGDSTDNFYYKFSAESSNADLYYTTDGKTLIKAERGVDIVIPRTTAVVFYAAIMPGYTSGSTFSHRNGSSSYTGTSWKSGTYTKIANAYDKVGDLDIRQSNAAAVAAGCDYEFHYSDTSTTYRYREFRITGEATSINVIYNVLGNTTQIRDNNNYRHPNVTDPAYADYLTQITVTSEVPTRTGYTFAGWLFRDHIYRTGDTLQIADLWSTEINTDVTYEFVAQWTARPSSLTINKTVTGGPTTLPETFEIVVNGSNGYRTTLDISDVDSVSGNTFTWTLDNLQAATYDVSETGYELTGYTHLGESSVTAGSVYVGTGQSGTISLENKYEIKKFTVIWVDEDGTELEKDENVVYGSEPEYNGETPTKAADDQYSYAFAGWTPEIKPVTDNITYKATYVPTTKTYTVKWVNYDGSELETDENVPYGADPEFNSKLPTKPSSAQYHYVFDKWSPTVSKVTGNVTYKAEFKEGSVRTYTVIWRNYNKETLETDENVPYGTVPEYNGSVPTQTADHLNTYKFIGWERYTGAELSDGKITGDTEFIAVFEAVPIPRTARVEVVLDGAESSDGESVTGGKHVKISDMIDGAEDLLFIQLKDGSGDYIQLDKKSDGIYAKRGVANGEYFIFTRASVLDENDEPVYTQLGTQVIFINDCDDTDYAPFYSVKYVGGEAGEAAANLPETDYYYTGSHVDVSRIVPTYAGHLFTVWSEGVKGEEGYAEFSSSTALETVHLDHSIKAPHVLTANWEYTVNIDVIVKVDTKCDDSTYYKNPLNLYLTREIEDGNFANVPGTNKEIEDWYESATKNGDVYTYTLNNAYTGIDKDARYFAEASLFGYNFVKRTVSTLDEDTKTYTVTFELEYDPTGFELGFDVYIDSNMPKRFVPTEVDVKITRWDGDSWEPIAEHVTGTTTVYIDTTHTHVVDGKLYFQGHGTQHVLAFSESGERYFYRVEIVNLDAIGSLAEDAAKATYYNVTMTSSDKVDYTSVESGFFPQGAYTGGVQVGEPGNECDGGHTSSGLHGTHVSIEEVNGEEVHVQHDGVSAFITAHPYTVELNTNYGEDDRVFETLENRFTIPSLEGKVPVREGFAFDDWYTDPDFGEGEGELGGKYITSIAPDLEAGGKLTLYAHWKADYTISGKLVADLGYPCSDTSRTVNVRLQHRRGAVFVDEDVQTVSITAPAGSSIAMGEYSFPNVKDDGEYRIYIEFGGGSVLYQNEPVSTDESKLKDKTSYSDSAYIAVRGGDTEAVVNAYLSAINFELGYMVDASQISPDYRPDVIVPNLYHDHGGSTFEKLTELPAINGLKADGTTDIKTVPVPRTHMNGTLFDYVFSVYKWTNSKVNGGNETVHNHYLDEVEKRKTFAPFEIDYTGPANYEADASKRENTAYQQDVILKAVFEPNVYAVEYVLNNGRWSVDGTAVRNHTWSFDTPITVEPVRDGYTFKGWTAKETQSGAEVILTTADGKPAVPADVWKDVTLTALWEADEYTINYNLAGGEMEEGTSNPETYKINSGSITLVNPVRFGYTFAGWTGTGLDEATMTVVIPTGSYGNREYTANWTINSYDITVEVENGIADCDSTVAVNYGSGIEIEFTADDGFALDSVTVDGVVAVLTDGKYTFSNVSDDHTIKVVYSADTLINSDGVPDKYQGLITYSVVNGSFVQGFIKQRLFTLKQYVDGVWVNVPETPTLGNTVPVIGTHTVPYEEYTEEGQWNNVPTADTKVTSSRVYVWTYTDIKILDVTYADFEKYKNDQVIPENDVQEITYGGRIVVDPNGGKWTSSLVSGAEGTYEKVESIYILDNAAIANAVRDYYHFTGWKWEESSAVDLAGTLTAMWEPIKYSVTYNLDGGEYPEGVTNPEFYTVEDSFTLNNPAKTGYIFCGWSGTEQNDVKQTVTVPEGSHGGREYLAHWKPAEDIRYTVEYHLKELGKTTYEENVGARVVAEGTTGENVTAEIKTFDGFTFDEGNVRNALEGTVKPDGSLVLRVYYTRNSYSVKYVNWNDAELKTYTAEFGAEIPDYDGETPTKTDDNPKQYTHTFKEWTAVSGSSIGADNTVAGEITYKAKYETSVNTYTVTWKNDNGEILETDKNVPYGTTPTYDGSTPLKGESYRYTYKHLGWTPEVSEVAGDATYTATFEATAKGHIANVLFVLNGTYDSANHEITTGTFTDAEKMLGANTTLYLKKDGEEGDKIYPLTSSTIDGRTVYSSQLIQNGTYRLYSSKDSTKPLSDQEISISNGDRTRYVMFYSITYMDGYSDSGKPLYTTYRNSEAKVDVNDPVRKDWVFLGWKVTKPASDTVLKKGDTITSHIEEEHVLTAQWEEETKANVNLKVIIDHTGNGGKDPNPGTSLKIDLARRTADSSELYTEVVGQSVNRTFEAENDGNTELTFNNVFTELSTDYDYTLNVFLPHYEVATSSDKYIIKEDTDNLGNKTYTITVNLKYNPDLFDFKYKVVVDSSVPDEYVPEAVDVKVIAFDANAAGEWAAISRHETTSAEVLINNRVGSGSYGVPVHKTVGENNYSHYLYSAAVAGVALPGDKEIYMIRSDTELTAESNFKSKAVDSLYAESAFTASVSLEFKDDETAEDGAYGHSEDHMTDFHQHGEVVITISANAYDVTLDLGYDGSDAGSANDILDVIEDQFRIPEDIHTNAAYKPADREEYSFDGWYYNGQPVVPGMLLTDNVTLTAKWREKLTISGTVYIDGKYKLEGSDTVYTIGGTDRLSKVTVLLQSVLSNGATKTVDHQEITLAYDSDGLGSQEFEFKHIPDDGKNYRITILQSSVSSVPGAAPTYNYAENYQNEKDSIDYPTDFTKYGNTANHFMADFDGDKTAVVNAYLKFKPTNFVLNYEIDASAVGEEFRPTNAEVFVLYDKGIDESTFTWDVISQQKHKVGEETIEKGQLINSFTGGIGAGSYPVWISHANGYYYDYAIRLQSLTYHELGKNDNTDVEKLEAKSNQLLGTIYPDMPFTIAYKYPAFFSAAGGEENDLDQNIILKATLTPKKYTVTFDANGGTLKGISTDTILHTWSKATDINTAKVNITAERDGFVFDGWEEVGTADLYDGKQIIASAAQNVKLKAKWTAIRDITFTGNSATKTYNGAEQSISGYTVSGLDGYDVTGVAFEAKGTDVKNGGYEGAFDSTNLKIVDGKGNDVTNQFNPVFINGVLTITPAKLTVTADDQTKQYDGKAFSDEFTYQISGFADGDDATDVGGNVEINYEALNAVNAGEYDIVPDVSGLEAVNYTFEAVKGELEITKVPLTVIASDHEKTYDGEVFVNFTYMIRGFVNGENSSVVTGDPEFDGAAKDATAVGSYDIVPEIGTLKADNYSFSNERTENGTLTIHKDENGDGIADHRQKKVTFTVVNGKWRDDSTEKIVYVPLNAFGEGALTVPTDMVADVGHEAGSWDAAIPTTVTGSDELSYTYTFTPKTGFTYTVKYIEKDHSENVLAESKTVGGKTYGDTVTAESEKITITGYAYDSASPAVLTIGMDENVLTLYYSKDEKQTKKLSYTVKHMLGNVEQTEDTKVYEETVWINAPDTLTVVDGSLDVKNYSGYYHFETENAPEGDTIADGTVVIIKYKHIVIDPPVNPGENGSVVLTKTDVNDAATKLQNVMFKLYSSDDTLVGTYKTSAEGKIVVENLAPGSYYWIETRPAEGYVLDSTEHNFTVNAGSTTELTVTNKRSKVPAVFSADHYAYIIGYTDGTVHPEASITRAEVATIFFRMLNAETRAKFITKANEFTDVDEGMWFNTAVSTMAAMNVINGYPDGTYRPNAKITRAEFAAIAARFDESANAGSISFTDVAGHWAEKEICIAANNGWILGYDDGSFKPKQNITRAEAMAMVNRVLQRLPENKDDLLADMVTWRDNMNTNKWYYLTVQEATNSHDYGRKQNGYEYWTELREVPDWTELEK